MPSPALSGRAFPGRPRYGRPWGPGSTPSSAQRLDVGGIAGRSAAEHRGAGHQGVGAGLDAAPGLLRIDTAIDLEVDLAALCIDHPAQGRDLGELAVDERLPAETRIDAHHQHEIEVAQP